MTTAAPREDDAYEGAAPWLPTTSYAVLGLLSFGDELSGYDLKKWADHGLRFFFESPAMSNIYAALKRLQSLGFVTDREVPQDDLRNKRVFTITPAGADEVRRWLAGSAVEPPVFKEHSLLRLLLGHLAERDRLVAMLEEQNRAATRTLAEIRYSLEASERDTAFSYAALAERFAARVQAARVEAFGELLDELRRLPDRPAATG